jgi:hypothetical protein
MGEKTENENLLNLFDIDHGKYQMDETGEDSPVNEKTDTEGVEDITPEPETVTTEDGNAIVEDDLEKDGDGKQTAEEEEKEQEDVPSDQDQEEVDEIDDESGLGQLMETLVDEDVLYYDEEKEYDLSVDGLKELVNETKEKAKEEGVQEFKNAFDEDGQMLLDILHKGGSVQDYISMSQQVDFSRVPLEDGSGNPIFQNQVALVEDWMRIQGYTNEEVDEKIRDLNDTGLLEKEAKFSQRKLASHQEHQRAQMMEQLEQQKIAQEQEQQQMAEAFREEVLNTKEIAGFKIGNKQAEKLYDYITKPIGPNGETQFTMDDNPQNRMLYAYFAMSGFDKDKLSKEVTSKQVLKLKKTLSNYEDQKSSLKGSGVRRNTSGGGGKLHIPDLF